VSQVAAQTFLRAFAVWRKFTVAEYHRMIDAGILTDEDQVELLENNVVLKMPRNPAHDGTIDLIRDALDRVRPAGWMLRCQQAITLADSEPEPDFALVRGDRRTYLAAHPGPADVGLVVEIANTSLDRDRLDKGRIYARAGIPVYWIVNLIDRVVEVYSVPSGATPSPAYGRKDEYRPGDPVPVALGGSVVGAVPGADLLP
jgi:Uma2 family endonuclease